VSQRLSNVKPLSRSYPNSVGRDIASVSSSHRSEHKINLSGPVGADKGFVGDVRITREDCQIIQSILRVPAGVQIWELKARVHARKQIGDPHRCCCMVHRGRT